MESDRYQLHPRTYVLGMVCLLLSMSLLLFSLYLVPYVIWQFNYDLPGWIFSWFETLKEMFLTTDTITRLLVWLSFVIPGLICGFFAWLASNQIDDELHVEPTDSQQPPPVSHLKEEVSASVSFGGRVLLLVILVILSVWFVDWLFFG